MNSNITRVSLLSEDNFYFVKARVVEVIEDNTINKEVNGGSQIVKVEITSGKYKRKICEANNMNGYLYGTYCEKGTGVIVQLSSYGDELSGSIYGYDRGNFIWIIVVILGIADMMGTMSNTLILAFAGGAINTMILIYAYIMPYLQVVNMYSIGIEVIKGISGTLGIVLTVPIVSVISAKMYNKKLSVIPGRK